MPRAFRGLTWAELAALMLAGLIAVIVAFRLMVPAAVWFQVGTISVSNATACEDLTVHYPRVIRHQFDGAWRVEIDRAVPGGWLAVATTPMQPETYEIDSVLPADDLVTFDWFTAGRINCEVIGPGIYRLTAIWIVNTGSWGGVLSRTVRRSDTFEVLE
jgi:hypothetical protein